MENIYETLKENPELVTFFLATSFTAIGFIAKTFIDTFLENKRYRKEIKKTYWAEKLDAAKKTSEFYYEQLELLGLMIHQIDIQIEQGFFGPLAESTQSTIEKIAERTLNPNSLEHHHIHMFYDIDTSYFDKLNTETYKIFQEMERLDFKESDSDDDFSKKIAKYKEYLLQMKQKHEEKKIKYKEHLREIRNDLNEFAK